MHERQGLADPQTRYIIKFDKPTLLGGSRQDFITALKKGSWRRDILFTPPQGSDPGPNDDKNPLSSAYVETTVVSQDTVLNPGSLHVTQRVGFNAGQEADVKALLDLIKH